MSDGAYGKLFRKHTQLFNCTIFLTKCQDAIATKIMHKYYIIFLWKTIDICLWVWYSINKEKEITRKPNKTDERFTYNDRSVCDGS